MQIKTGKEYNHQIVVRMLNINPTRNARRIAMRNRFGFIHLLIAIVVLSPASLSLSAQQGGYITWPKGIDLNATDRQDILTLAKRMGIEDPQRVSLVGSLPVLCQWLRVDSAITQSGQLRTWLELRLGRRDWAKNGCLRIPPDSSPRQVGRWVATDQQIARQWRIQEDGWHVDVRTDSSPVSYEDVKFIVLAIRHGRLLDRRLVRGCEIRDIDASTITRIWVLLGDKTTYGVATERGETAIFLRVKTVQGQVELHECGPLQ